MRCINFNFHIRYVNTRRSSTQGQKASRSSVPPAPRYVTDLRLLLLLGEEKYVQFTAVIRYTNHHQNNLGLRRDTTDSGIRGHPRQPAPAHICAWPVCGSPHCPHDTTAATRAWTRDPLSHARAAAQHISCTHHAMNAFVTPYSCTGVHQTGMWVVADSSLLRQNTRHKSQAFP